MWTYNATYESFDGEIIKEKLHFNLTKQELTELEVSADDGYSEFLQRIVDTKDRKELIKIFKQLIDISYGVKADDGKRFYKNEKILEDFKATNAYSDLFCALSTDSKLAAEFVMNILPKDLVAEVKKTKDFKELMKDEATEEQ